MAKKEKLSPEELLEQALVKEEDQPYVVPDNWVWTKLGEVVLLIGGGTPSKEVDEFWNGSILWASVKDIKHQYLTQTEDKITELGFEKSSTTLAEPGDVILVTRIAPGESTISLVNVAINQDLKVVKAKIPINSIFLWGYFKFMFSQIESMSSGTTVKGVTIDKVYSLAFPLPPLSEQQRIVAIIESLFEKLDRAKELAQNALDSFENRKSAILHKAFSGEMTRKWREENGGGFKWQQYKIKNLILKLDQGWSPKCENYPSNDYAKWGVIKTTAIQQMNFIELENKYLPDNLIAREKHELKAGDILITRAGPRVRVGVCCYVKQVRPRLLLCDKAYRFIIKKELIMAEYIVYVLNSPDMQDRIDQMKTGISDSGVNLTQKGFLALDLNVPPLPEQQEIVRILDNLLENEQKAKELCDVIDKIDHMKKSILARAFRGELGTNNPDEESALKLLKEVLKAKA